MNSKEIKEAICNHIKTNPDCVKKLVPINETLLTMQSNWYRCKRRKTGSLIVRTFMCSASGWFCLDEYQKPQLYQFKNGVPSKSPLYMIGYEVTSEANDSIISHMRLIAWGGDSGDVYLE